MSIKGVHDMKTLFIRIFNHRLQRAGSLMLSGVLVLFMVAMTLPQPVLAAATTTCAAYYTVQPGDKTSKIAHSYRLHWAVIARANNRKPSTPIKAGEVLCIPSETTTVTSETGTMTAYATNNILTVTMSGFDTRYIWNVNVRDVRKKVPGVFKVGRMVVPANTSVTKAFELPQDLQTTSYLMVCVKNLTTDEKICHNIYHNV
jgi:LysM repeat protein